jgi:organic hydroperoxide reductase OsmC/OhrA
MLSNTFFSHGNTRFSFNRDFSGEVTITTSNEEGVKEVKVSGPALAAFAAHIVRQHLEGSFNDTLPPEELLWSVVDACHSGTEHLGKVRAKTSEEAYEKALEKWGDPQDTDGESSLAVRLT